MLNGLAKLWEAQRHLDQPASHRLASRMIIRQQSSRLGSPAFPSDRIREVIERLSEINTQLLRDSVEQEVFH